MQTDGQAERQTDGHDEGNRHFSQLCEQTEQQNKQIN